MWWMARRHIVRLAPALLLPVIAGCASGGGSSPTSPSAATFQLTGTVLDASALVPLSGVTVSVVDQANVTKTARTGASGRYVLDLASGTFVFRAQQTGYVDFTQELRLTGEANIDLRLTPQRSLNTGWSVGRLAATNSGARMSTRTTTIQVTQTGSSLTGSFTGADGSSGTFSGQLNGTQFTGTMRAQIVFDTRRCSGAQAAATGTATPDVIDINVATMALENCSGAATDVVLNLTP